MAPTKLLKEKTSVQWIKLYITFVQFHKNKMQAANSGLVSLYYESQPIKKKYVLFMNVYE